MSRVYNFAFIDGANLHFTYENLDWKLDYQKLRNYLKKKLNVSIAYYFIGKTAAFLNFNSQIRIPAITKKVQYTNVAEIIVK